VNFSITSGLSFYEICDALAKGKRGSLDKRGKERLKYEGSIFRKQIPKDRKKSKVPPFPVVVRP
jgi:hypothetical protein